MSQSDSEHTFSDDSDHEGSLADFIVHDSEEEDDDEYSSGDEWGEAVEVSSTNTNPTTAPHPTTHPTTQRKRRRVIDIGEDSDEDDTHDSQYSQLSQDSDTEEKYDPDLEILQQYDPEMENLGAVIDETGRRRSRRQRTTVTRYQDEDFLQLMMEDVSADELDDEESIDLNAMEHDSDSDHSTDTEDSQDIEDIGPQFQELSDTVNNNGDDPTTNPTASPNGHPTSGDA